MSDKSYQVVYDRADATKIRRVQVLGLGTEGTKRVFTGTLKQCVKLAHDYNRKAEAKSLSR